MCLLPPVLSLCVPKSCSVFHCGPLAGEKAFTCSLIASPSQPPPVLKFTREHLHCFLQPSCSHGHSNTSKAQQVIGKPSTATSISSAPITSPPWHRRLSWKEGTERESRGECSYSSTIWIDWNHISQLETMSKNVMSGKQEQLSLYKWPWETYYLSAT